MACTVMLDYACIFLLGPTLYSLASCGAMRGILILLVYFC